MDKKKKYRKRPLEEHNLERLKDLSAILRDSRLWTGQSMLDIATEHNMSPNLLFRAESGYNLQLSTVFELADIYEMTVSELFEGVE